MVERLSQVQLDWRAAPDKWSVGEIIDHLLLSPGLKPSLRAAGVDSEHRAREHASDHAATWIEIDKPAA